MKPTETIDFELLIQYQSALNEADNQLASIDAVVQPQVTAIVDQTRDRWAAAKSQRDEAEAQIRTIANRHPEWMDGKQIKTPFGSIAFRTTIKLDVPNPDATVALIRHHLDESFSKLAIRTLEEPRLEVLETLDPAQLSKIGITRSEGTTITVKPAKVDMAKSTKSKKGAAA